MNKVSNAYKLDHISLSHEKGAGEVNFWEKWYGTNIW
jgi:hypothetical protein